MTSIYKTAYPYFSSHKKLTRDWLVDTYSLAPEEIVDIKKRLTDPDSQLSYAVLLTVFKQFNYFPDVNTIPQVLIDFMKEQLHVPIAKPHCCSSVMRNGYST